MSAEQLHALMAAGDGDPAIRERFTSAKTADEVVAIAAELGFDVTADDFAAERSDELSEAELGAVAGGTEWLTSMPTMDCWTKTPRCW